MAVKIRLKRLGKIRSPHYRVVVMDARTKRDGRAIEEIGLYHPKNDPSVISINSERAQYWLSVGAQPTEAVVALLKRTGDWQKFSGETGPSGVDPQPTRPDKVALFNSALAEADDEPTTAAISKSRKKVQAQPAEESSTQDNEKPAASAASESEAPAQAAAEADGSTQAEASAEPEEAAEPEPEVTAEPEPEVTAEAGPEDEKA